MKIICPEHEGVIRLTVSYFNENQVRLSQMVVECPVCDDEVLIDGVFDFDNEGLGTPSYA